MLEPDESFIAPIAYKLSGRYRGIVDREDVAQELRIWWMTHEKAVERWEYADERDKNKRAYRLKSDLWKAGERFARKERAQYLGYDPSDEAFYDRERVRELLPMVYNPDLMLTADPNAGEAKVKTGKAPNEGNNLPTSVADVSQALDRLNGSDQDLLLMLHGEELQQKEVAEILDVSVAVVKMRHHRALTRIVGLLGGDTPWTEGPGARRAMSNAAAQALTSNQWEV